MQKSTLLGAAALAAAAGTLSSADAAVFNTLTGDAPIVIAHRGASAYVSENTLASTEMALDMAAPYVENDVQMTKDGVLVVMHDGTLDRTTNIENLYERRNGGYNVADFTLAEIKQLTVDTKINTGYDFLLSGDKAYEVPTFAEQLDLISTYNAANGTDYGILVEGKYGFNADTNRAVMETLKEKGYTTADKAMIQSFDFGNVFDYALLEDELGMDLGIAQLGDASWNGYAWTVSNLISLQNMAQYTDTVAISYGSLSQAFIDAAHDLGLSVYGWTFRPADLEAAESLMASFLDWGLDGFITDNPDLVDMAIGATTSFASAQMLLLADDSLPAVPVPAALPLLCTGLGALALLRRRRARAA
ncbi:VPLPA-CTERM sorting domain-containing protein [Sinirhodobacter populi]|uniref:VPLPA-CTERM sorting domain-containing protein n=1 Tax=Paenirhodobacter populi TaxID=2306993 RepID=A0A443K176_9RHOB|nr:glycerophosphodiester phosphodiesterase family protein [Sinirhodobacter populi]RWR26503.1 VPLPA-CTERM sorting domain-containing protein [Sinirhodobacter populi]